MISLSVNCTIGYWKACPKRRLATGKKRLWSLGTWKLFRLAVWAGLSWAGLSWAGAHCQPSSSAPGGWLALGWGNMATRLRVSQHPAGRPVLVCTQTWKASKSSKWASTHAEALCKVLLVSCLQCLHGQSKFHGACWCQGWRRWLHVLMGEVGHQCKGTHIQGGRKDGWPLLQSTTGAKGWHLGI